MCSSRKRSTAGMAAHWLDMTVLRQGHEPHKKVELLEGATVGDILKKVAQLKQVPAGQLFLTEKRWTDKAHCLCRLGPSEAGTIVGGAGAAAAFAPSGAPLQVKLHRNEVPEGEVHLGGVEDLEGLPDIITVEPRLVRTELTKTEAVDLQDQLIAAYSQEPIQRSLEKLQAKFHSGLAPSKYPRMLAEVLLPTQRKVFPKWGFDPPPRGHVQMHQAFRAFDDDQEVQLRVTILNGLIGLDFAWFPEEKEAKP